jgi:hypothetical protein
MGCIEQKPTPTLAGASLGKTIRQGRAAVKGVGASRGGGN